MEFIVTEGAAKEILKVQEEQKLEDAMIRVNVAGGGCSGLKYELNFIEKTAIEEGNDEVFEHHGVSVVVDKKSIMYLDGTTLDWYSDLSKRGFTFNNPNSTRSCGCGESFSC